jgi:hypothetical protein
MILYLLEQGQTYDLKEEQHLRKHRRRPLFLVYALLKGLRGCERPCWNAMANLRLSVRCF